MQQSDAELIALVKSLVGLRCWYVSCGGAAGTTFQLALGNKVPRRVPLKNSAHTEEYRHLEGEASILVWCVWRLDGPAGPLTSWDDAEANVASQLEKLVNQKIESIDVQPPAWDVTLHFSGDLTLQVFCDHVPGDPSFDGNWQIRYRDQIAAVGPGTKVGMEKSGWRTGESLPLPGNS